MAAKPTNNGCRVLEAKLAELQAELSGFQTLMAERHERYSERDAASKESVRNAFAAAEKAGEKTEQALTEYKIGANEWRDTVKDLIARTGGQATGISEMKDESRANISLIIAVITAFVVLGRALTGH